jgi:hypothetical protein
MFLIESQLGVHTFKRQLTAGKGKNKLYKAIESELTCMYNVYDSFDIRKKI